MPKLRRLSGPDVVRILETFGFKIFSQRGSHIKLRRIIETGEKQNLTIPNHKQLDPGTCKAIFRQATRFIAADELRSYFYNE
ncbi:MAG TPA: type II toxin-antitoxin system HicA family toxin [Caldithrix sp.]|nr:type II toxin-antitoxin system HicA family toxin [Caldithrix sp.]